MDENDINTIELNTNTVLFSSINFLLCFVEIKFVKNNLVIFYFTKNNFCTMIVEYKKIMKK